MPVQGVTTKQEMDHLAVESHQPSTIYTWSLKEGEKLTVIQDQKGNPDFRLETANAVSREVFLAAPLPSHSKPLTEQDIIALCNNSYPKLVELSDGSHKLYLHTRGLGGMMQEEVQQQELITHLSQQDLSSLSRLNQLAIDLPRTPQALKTLMFAGLNQSHLNQASEQFETAINNIAEIYSQVGTLATTWRDDTCRTLISSCALFKDSADKIRKALGDLREAKANNNCKDAIRILSLLIADVQACKKQSQDNQNSIAAIRNGITTELNKLLHVGIVFTNVLKQQQVDYLALQNQYQEQADQDRLKLKTLIIKSVLIISATAAVSALTMGGGTAIASSLGGGTVAKVAAYAIPHLPSSVTTISFLKPFINTIQQQQANEEVRKLATEDKRLVLSASSAICKKMQIEVQVLETALKAVHDTLQLQVNYWMNIGIELELKEKDLKSTQGWFINSDPSRAIDQTIRRVENYDNFFTNTLLTSINNYKQRLAQLTIN